MNYYAPDMANPAHRLADYLSELHNDNAPIGWNTYIPMAKLLIEKFDLANAVMVKLKSQSHD